MAFLCSDKCLNGKFYDLKKIESVSSSLKVALCIKKKHQLIYFFKFTDKFEIFQRFLADSLNDQNDDQQ